MNPLMRLWPAGYLRSLPEAPIDPPAIDEWEAAPTVCDHGRTLDERCWDCDPPEGDEAARRAA